MFKFYLTLFFSSFCLMLHAQSSVEKSLTSLQFNLSSVELVNESALSDKTTLRLNVGTQLNGRLNIFTVGNPRTYLTLRPYFGAGVRHYYNLSAREAEGRVTTNNSGNFISLTGEFRPDFFLWNDNDNEQASNDTSVNALWGLRRQLGQRFDFEFTAGVRMNVENFPFSTIGGLSGCNIVLGWRFGYRF